MSSSELSSKLLSLSRTVRFDGPDGLGSGQVMPPYPCIHVQFDQILNFVNVSFTG
jgi:hypothetical protein